MLLLPSLYASVRLQPLQIPDFRRRNCVSARKQYKLVGFAHFYWKMFDVLGPSSRDLVGHTTLELLLHVFVL